MKKYIYVCLLIVILLITGCGSTTYSKYEADDIISQAVNEAINKEDIYYQGKHTSVENVIYYEYLIIREENGQLEQIVDAVNEVLQSENIDEKVNIDCRITLPGGDSGAANLANYSDETNEKPDYDTLQRLCIGGADYGIYAEPSTFKNLPNIKKLEVYGDIQWRAEKQGIDWYEYWPELESVEVFE